MPAFAIQLNIFWNSIVFKEKKVSFFTIIKCYSNWCVQNADCRLHTGGVGLSFLDRLIFRHSWWLSKETFLGVASVISRPANCLVSIAGEHFFCVNGSRPMLKTFVYHTRLTFDSIFYLGTITCFVYPSANRSLLLQERTGHLGAQPVETRIYRNCFFEPFLLFCPQFWILKRVAAVLLFPDSHSRYLTQQIYVNFIFNSTISSQHQLHQVLDLNIAISLKINKKNQLKKNSLLLDKHLLMSKFQLSKTGQFKINDSKFVSTTATCKISLCIIY